MLLLQNTIDFVKVTATFVASNGEAIVSTFFHDLLTDPNNVDIMLKFPNPHHISQETDAELAPSP